MVGRFLDLGLATALVWLVLAGLASTFLEGIRLLFGRRQKALFAAIGTLLDGTDRPSADSVTAAAYRTERLRHFIPWRRRRRLARQRPVTWYRPRPPDSARQLASTGPEWLPPRVFGAIITDASFREKLPEGVKTNISGPSGGPCSTKAEAWFEDAMDVVSTDYRRWTRAWLFLIGLAAAIAFQIDALSIVTELWSDQALHDQLVRSGVENADSRILDGLPIGWSCPPGNGDCDRGARIDEHLTAMRLIGWPATALAISLGAPFWFEIVGRVTRSRDRRSRHSSAR